MSKSLEIKKEKDKALTYSIKEGSSASVSTSLSDLFLTPLITLITPLKNQGLVVGVLSSLSTITSQIGQYYGSKLIKKHPRKEIVRNAVLIQACLWLPIASLSLFYLKGILTGILPILLIIFYSLITLLAGLAHPAWFSWMGDLVPEKQRGKYFSKRNLVIGIVGLITAIVGGLWLDFLKIKVSQEIFIIGFSIIFVFAFIFRMISYSFFKYQYAPPNGYKKEKYLKFKEFFKVYPNFKKFSIYQMFFNLSIMIASPFFALYMLNVLKLSYTSYILVSISSTAFYLIFLPIIGKFSDKKGNLKLLYLANICFGLNPFLWMLIKNPLLLIFIPQIIVGLGNAALIIAVNNFTYGSISNHHRGIGTAYSNILIGVGTVIGSLIGGILLKVTEEKILLSSFIIIFLIAGILRFGVGLWFLPKLKEVKYHDRSHHLHHSISHPFRSINNEVHHMPTKNHTNV